MKGDNKCGNNININTVESDIKSQIKFNDIALKYRYDLMQCSKDFEEECHNKSKYVNLFEKVKVKGAAFDNDIIQRQKKRKPLRITHNNNSTGASNGKTNTNMSLNDIGRINSVQDIKKASEIFNKYIDSLANKNKTNSHLKYYSALTEDTNDNDIQDFINHLNKEFMNKKENNFALNINSNNTNNDIFGFDKLKVCRFKTRNKNKPLLKALNSFNKNTNLYINKTDTNITNKKKVYFSFNKNLLTKRNIHLDEKGKCNFNATKGNNTPLGATGTFNLFSKLVPKRKECISSYRHINNNNLSTSLSTENVRVRSNNLSNASLHTCSNNNSNNHNHIAPHFAVPLHRKTRSVASLSNIDNEISLREYNKYQEIKKINKHMLRLYNNNKDKLNKYHIKLTAAKIHFLQTNISNMIMNDAAEFNNKVDHIWPHSSYPWG